MKPRIGRPPRVGKSGAANRITIRVTRYELADLSKAAKKTKLSLSAWIRHLALTEAEALR